MLLENIPTENGFNSYPVSHCIAVELCPWPWNDPNEMHLFWLLFVFVLFVFWFHINNNLLFPTLRIARTQDIASINPPLLVFQTFHADWSYFILSPMNPIRFPLFRNSQEAMLNCLLIRPLWHDHNCSVCTHTHKCTNSHLHARTGASIQTLTHFYLHF